ncbi:MAG: hypothetical protein L6V93_05770 [Clostridiales bacterium]|nr:MAG: hypothetical protein L6V93_05770 [Clostridiales bacterium]
MIQNLIGEEYRKSYEILLSNDKKTLRTAQQNALPFSLIRQAKKRFTRSIFRMKHFVI